MENQVQLYRRATNILLGKDLAIFEKLDEQLAKREQAGREKGYDEGYQEAKDKYCVVYYCSRCFGKLEVTSDDEKKAIKGYMRQHGWRHANCGEYYG